MGLRESARCMERKAWKYVRLEHHRRSREVGVSSRHMEVTTEMESLLVDMGINPLQKPVLGVLPTYWGSGINNISERSTVNCSHKFPSPHWVLQKPGKGRASGMWSTEAPGGSAR